MNSKIGNCLIYGLVAALFFTSICFLLIINFSKIPAITEESLSYVFRPIFKEQNIVLLSVVFIVVFVFFFLVKFIKPEKDKNL